MNLSTLLARQRAQLCPRVEELRILKKRVAQVVKFLRTELTASQKNAKIFVGGSFAKGTLVKREGYDIDIFVRFALLDEESLVSLERSVHAVATKELLTVKRVHGSRDYFQLSSEQDALIFEIIPVKHISRPSKAENVTDLSYFHVAYVTKRAKKIADEIRLAKQFCRAQGVYGAESYIRGFSGYGLECLLIHYKTFLSFLRALARTTTPLFIDPAKHYKNALEARLSLNEAKIQAPIVFVDPTHKERNVLAALSQESFLTVQRAAKAFLARPSESFFVEKKFDLPSFIAKGQSKKAASIALTLITDRQAGDIAGTKLKKTASYFEAQFLRRFVITQRHFEYGGEREAKAYFSLVPIKEEEVRGPPLKMIEPAKAFRKKHKKTIVRAGRLLARVPLTLTPMETFNEIMKNREQLYHMGLVDAQLHVI